MRVLLGAGWLDATMSAAGVTSMTTLPNRIIINNK